MKSVGGPDKITEMFASGDFKICIQSYFVPEIYF